MNDGEVIDRVVGMWERHNRMNLLLVGAIPDGGFAAVPLASRGRTVAAQLVHMLEVRSGWLHHHETGQRPKRGPRVAEPGRAWLTEAFTSSGTAVASFLARAFRGEAKVRMFGGDPARFLGYLVSHESHHRGQIALALKQDGRRLPERVALQGLWGGWFSGA